MSFPAAAVVMTVRIKPPARRKPGVMNYFDNECAHAWLVNHQPRFLSQIHSKQAVFLFLCHTESYAYPSLLLLQFSGHFRVKALLLVTNSYAFAMQWQPY